MSNTKKILKEIASGEEYKELADAVDQADYEIIFNSYIHISDLINSGRERIEEGIQNMPVRSRNERLDKFRQSFELAVERNLPIWHQLSQALKQRQIMEGEVFAVGKKGDPLVRTPVGTLVALRGSKLEEGSRVRFVVDYEGEKISIGREFSLNPHTFYMLITQESRERIRRSLAAIDELMKTGQELLKEGSFLKLEEIFVELEEVKNLPSAFKADERDKIISQAVKYRNRLLNDIAVKSMFDIIAEREEKDIEDFFGSRQEEKNKALSALGLFRYCTYEIAEKLLKNEKPEDYSKSLSEIEDDIDSMESAMKLMDYRAAIERAYPKAQSYIEKMRRLLDRLPRSVGRITDTMPQEGVINPDDVRLAVENTFTEEMLLLELKKTFRTSKEFFSQRGAFTELIKKLGDQDSIAAEVAFRSYLEYRVPQAFAER